MVQYERDCRTSFAGLDCLSVEWLFVGRNLDCVAEPDLEANFRLEDRVGMGAARVEGHLWRDE